MLFTIYQKLSFLIPLPLPQYYCGDGYLWKQGTRTLAGDGTMI